MLLGAGSSKHELSYSCPSEGLLDWTVFYGSVLYDCTVNDVFVSKDWAVLAALVTSLNSFWFNVIEDISEGIVASLADEQLYHFGVADLHGYFERRDLWIRRIGRAFHCIEDILQYFDVSGVDCWVDHWDMVEDGVDVDFHLFFRSLYWRPWLGMTLKYWVYGIVRQLQILAT